MKIRLGLFVAALILPAMNANAAEDGLSFRISDLMEEQVIAGMAGRVSRIDEHVLQIKFAGGERRFADEPPHEPLDGLHWRFCGYSNLTRAYLIGKNHFGRFTGVLLLEDNGIILNAGHTVLFSPSGIAFLAIEQEDGMGGELWSVYGISGEKLWSGFAGILKRDPGNTYDFRLCAI